MRRLPLPLTLFAVVALIWPLSQRAVSAPLEVFRLATLNIHKGTDRRNTYHLDKTIEAIRRLNADVVGLQEVMDDHPALRCDDQAALIAAGLRQLTGEPWTFVAVKTLTYEGNHCRPAGDEVVATESIAVLSRYPILSHESVELTKGRAALAVRVAALPEVPIVVTHLSANADKQALRVQEVSSLVPWTLRNGAAFLVGDLNARPDTSEIAPVYTRFRDGWADAAASGRISGITTGSTRPGRRVSRIDYVFYEPSMPWVVDSAEVADMATIPDLGEVTDHHAVVVTFRRR